MTDNFHRLFREGDCLHNEHQVAGDNGHFGHINGNIGTLAHGYANVGSCQRLRVVYAVANHGHYLALLLQLCYKLGLIGWESLGLEVVDANLLRNGSGRLMVIAREHVHLNAQLLELSNGLGGGGLHPIGNGGYGNQAVVLGHEHNGLGLFFQPFYGCL